MFSRWHCSIKHNVPKLGRHEYSYDVQLLVDQCAGISPYLMHLPTQLKGLILLVLAHGQYNMRECNVQLAATTWPTNYWMLASLYVPSNNMQAKLFDKCVSNSAGRIHSSKGSTKHDAVNAAFC